MDFRGDEFAASHSFASVSAFVMIVIAVGGKLSNIARFLAVHRFQRIHGARGDSARPVGGRLTALSIDGRSCRGDEAEGSKFCIEIGAISQTC